jgi:two-component system cell cycle sensor histidine kinase/response regulator CckA
VTRKSSRENSQGRGLESEEGAHKAGTGAVLRESKELFEKIFRSQMDAIFILDAANPPRIIDCNPAAEIVFGYSRDEMMGTTTQLLHVDRNGVEDFQKQLYPQIQWQGFFHLNDFMMRRKDGEVFPSEHTVAPLNDEQGVRTGWVSVIRDITQRKRVERALVESEEKYRLLMENANEAIFILQEGRVEFPNRRAREIGRLLGVNLQKAPFAEYIHPLDRDWVTDRHRRRMRGHQLPDTYNFRLIGKENREIWVELSAALITWEGKPASLNFLRDITRQKEIEARLQQVLRMEALGTLAAGIAHDFNNLLMGIQGRLSLMLLNLETSHAHYRDLREMENIVSSGSDLTKQLLGFTRGGRYEVKPANINDLIHETVALFGRARKPIQIHRRLRRDVWALEIDRGQVGQVLLNLLVNAAEAMPDGGHLYLQTRNAVLSNDFVAPHGVPAGRFVKITVRDTGVGMDERTLQRVFEPFFTTKEMGRGTGLGLASAYGVVRNHGGIIVASSKPGAGTIFEIYLPASEKKVLKEATPSLGPIPGGTETILFVDDEPRVLDICERFLKRSGYSVLPARNGSEAIKIFETQKRSIDIVVLDMIMPDMSGKDVLDRLKANDPDVKVLVSTGYAIPDKAPELARGHRVNFIQKPYSFRTLAREIRRILQ